MCKGFSVWFQLPSPWWLIVLDIWKGAHWPLVYLLWKNILKSFTYILFKFLLVNCNIYTAYIHWKDWCWSWNSNTLATWCEELTHWKTPWCWERLMAGREGDDRGWDGWMASLTQWTWVWASSGSWWQTGKPGMLQSVGLQRVGHEWAVNTTELKIYTLWIWGPNQTDKWFINTFPPCCGLSFHILNSALQRTKILILIQFN